SGPDAEVDAGWVEVDTHGSPETWPLPPEPTGNEHLAMAGDCLAAADHALAIAVWHLQEALADRTGPRMGIATHQLLAQTARLTGIEARTLVTVARVLNHLPGVHRRWEHGMVSWSQVRGIAAAFRTIDVSARADVDRDLCGVIDRGDEPDRVVEHARWLADLTLAHQQ